MMFQIRNMSFSNFKVMNHEKEIYLKNTKKIDNGKQRKTNEYIFIIICNSVKNKITNIPFSFQGKKDKFLKITICKMNLIIICVWLDIGDNQ